MKQKKKKKKQNWTMELFLDVCCNTVVLYVELNLKNPKCGILTSVCLHFLSDLIQLQVVVTKI